MSGRPPRSTLFPYPALFRSEQVAREVGGAVPPRRVRLDMGARELARQIDDLALRLGEAGGLNRDRHRSPDRSCGPGAPPRPSCATAAPAGTWDRSEEHTSELQSQSNLVCRLLLE